MQITRKGQLIDVPGKQPEVGEVAPAFSLKNLQDQMVSLANLKGNPTILSIIPDIDTRVCAIQTKYFNHEASQLAGINFATISNNTKAEQANWCGQEGIDMTMLHDPENTFGQAYNLYMPELGRYARSIFVLDREGVIRYREIVPEMSHEPDYARAIAAAKSLA
jgi:thiol peroxidase